MRLLITGGTGQLGHDVTRIFSMQGHDVFAPTRRQMNLDNPEEAAYTVRSFEADWVINCGAYTQVDRAESEPDKAFTVNRDSAAAIAESVARYGGNFLQVSTDFVFDGSKPGPYIEQDRANPLGVYGQSKLEGDLAVLNILPKAVMLRTAWVYGAHGRNNFVKTMLRVAATGEPLRVVNDQVGSPTWTTDIAATIVMLVSRGEAGIFNYTNAGETSWHGFAVAILDEASTLGFDVKTEVVEPIATSDYPTPATRPAYSVLDTNKIKNRLGISIPQWRDSLKNMLRELQTCADC